MIYDLTLPLHAGMVIFPGDPPFARKEAASLKKGDSCNLTAISLGSHTGTHLDAPSHIFLDGPTVDRIPLDDLIGPAKVIDLQMTERIIRPEHIKDKDIGEGDRLLFKTRNSSLYKGKVFSQDYTYLSEDAADWLVKKKIRLVGIDYLSIDAFAGDNPCHKILLAAGVIILEGLNLIEAPAGSYLLVALPLKIKDCDGSPLRVVLLDSREIRSNKQGDVW